MRINKGLLILLSLVLVLFTGCFPVDVVEAPLPKDQVVTEESIDDSEDEGIEYETQEDVLDEDEYYYDMEDVALYIHTYKKLPQNYITKSESREMGWEADDDSGLVVGGDIFQNREGQLPEKEGRTYYEADVSAGYTNHRGPERIVFSNDGLIYYTSDHYESFEKLY